MKLGREAMEALQAEITGNLKPGDELVVAGPVGLSGTVLIAKRKYGFLRKYFSESFLYDAMNLMQDYGVESLEQEKLGVEQSTVWKLAQSAGASALYALGEGGILSGVWKMTEAAQTGLKADLRKIPVRQESIEICEVFGLNPYKLLSGGAVLIGIQGGEILAAQYRRMGLMAEVIGQTDRGNARLLYSGENARYLERPGADEVGGVTEEWRG